MTRTAYNVQRDFALSSGLRSEIIWDSLTSEQSEVLKQKIATLLPDVECKGSDFLDKQRQELFENVWQQRKYTNTTLLSAIIYVLITEERDLNLAQESTNFTCHPVFRTRKCMNADNSAGCCMVFIDEYARVYTNWKKFVNNNAYGKGTMIAPAQGVYVFNEADEVQLEMHPTAASRTKSFILNASDKVASVGGVVSTVPIAVALAVPVAAPIAIAATAVGVATAAYSTVRSVSRLIDRRWHGQTTSLRNREARGNWLGVAGGVVGLGATGVTTAVSRVAAAGQEVGVITKFAVNGINVGSIVISGTGAVNGFYDLYMKINDEQTLTGFDVLQIASSLVIFTHSINNFKIAAKFTRGSGASLRRDLRNQTRKVFDKISRETAKLRNNGSIDSGIGAGGGNIAAGKFDIIRTLNEIPFKEVLLSLHKLNSHLTSATSAATALGAALLPNIISIGSGGNLELNLQELAAQYGPKFVQHITSFGNFLDVLDALSKYLCERAVVFFMDTARKFVEENVDNIDRVLNTFVSSEAVLYRMLMHCVTNFEEFTVEHLEKQRRNILNEIEKYFKSLNPINYDCRKHKCSTCKGYFYISKL